MFNSLYSSWKKQSILIKLISGLLIFIFACCVCSIPLSIITPDRTPTPKPVAQENSAAPLPTDTSAPIAGPTQVDTPVPADTPVPTNTPIPDLAFNDVIQAPSEKGWTETQYSTYFETIKGRQVSGWSGAILEIDEYGGRPYLSLDMKPGDPKIDAYLYISKDDVLKVGLGQNLIFAGTIDSTWSEGEFYALQIEDVTLLELGDIPPTPTAAPTGTPTPDIGNKIEAEVMCKDFVRDNLKSPSSADFGGFLDDWDEAVFINSENASTFGVDTGQLRNSGIWVVRGQVDAQNSFGAMIRSKYICVMDYEKSTQTWYLLDISIE